MALARYPRYLIAWENKDRYETLWSLHNLPDDATARLKSLVMDGHALDHIYVCGPWGLLTASEAMAKLKED